VDVYLLLQTCRVNGMVGCGIGVSDVSHFQLQKPVNLYTEVRFQKLGTAKTVMSFVPKDSIVS